MEAHMCTHMHKIVYLLQGLWEVLCQNHQVPPVPHGRQWLNLCSGKYSKPGETNKETKTHKDTFIVKSMFCPQLVLCTYQLRSNVQIIYIYQLIFLFLLESSTRSEQKICWKCPLLGMTLSQPLNHKHTHKPQGHWTDTHVHSDTHTYVIWLTLSTSFSGSVSAGKCFRILSRALSRSSVMGPSGVSPSAIEEAGLRGTEDRTASSSPMKSAAGPEPARTSQGVDFLRETSNLCDRE